MNGGCEVIPEHEQGIHEYCVATILQDEDMIVTDTVVN